MKVRMEGKYTTEGKTRGKYIYRICLWKVKKQSNHKSYSQKEKQIGCTR